MATTKVTKMTYKDWANSDEAQELVAEWKARAEAAEAKLAAKAARKAKRQPKTLVPAKEAVHNADYTGFMLTLASTEEVLAAIAEVQSSPWTKHPVYVKIAGHALINGELVNYTSLVPVIIHDGVFKLYNGGDTLTPVDNTWTKVRVVTMRPSAVERYYIGNGTVAKKHNSDATDTTASDTEEEILEDE